MPKKPEEITIDPQFGFFGQQRLAFIVFFLSSDITEYKRTIYGPLDFLGDVGGLSDALIYIGSFLVSITQFLTGDHLSHKLIARIFEKDNSH